MHLRVTVQPRLSEQIDNAARRARFRIARSEDYSGNARVHDGADAHGAGFQGHIQRGSRQPVVAKLLRAGPQGLDLGVGCRIGTRDRRIETLANDGTIEDQDRTHGDFSNFASMTRPFQRAAHELRIECSIGSIVRLGASHASEDSAVIEKILAHLDAKAAADQASRPPPSHAPPARPFG